MEAIVYGGLSLIGLIVWLARLEGKTDGNTAGHVEQKKSLDDHIRKDEEHQKEVLEKLADIREAIGEIRGHLKT